MRVKVLYMFLLSNLMMLVTGCNMLTNDNIEEVLIYKKGQIKKINIGGNSIKKCFDNVPNQFDLLITNIKINKIKKEENGIEFIFSKDVQYKIQPINKTEIFKKAFIPLSGKYKKILFLGHDNGYGSFTPYGVVNCDLINDVLKTIKVK